MPHDNPASYQNVRGGDLAYAKRRKELMHQHGPVADALQRFKRGARTAKKWGKGLGRLALVAAKDDLFDEDKDFDMPVDANRGKAMQRYLEQGNKFKQAERLVRNLPGIIEEVNRTPLKRLKIGPGMQVMASDEPVRKGVAAFHRQGVVYYPGKSIRPDTYRHEVGHNIQSARWGPKAFNRAYAREYQRTGGEWVKNKYEQEASHHPYPRQKQRKNSGRN